MLKILESILLSIFTSFYQNQSRLNYNRNIIFLELTLEATFLVKCSHVKYLEWILEWTTNFPFENDEMEHYETNWSY
jgi:hypothetical protein